jgi:uncharacterized lipoprotein YmbA
MIARRPIVPWLVLLAASIGVAACAVTDTTRYYALGQVATRKTDGVTGPSTPTNPPRSDASQGGTGTVAIGVGPVSLPGYLDRIQVVTRSGGDQVDLSPFYRWAEPLDEGIGRVLAEEIAARVPTDRIVTYPWRGTIARAIHYQVVVAVLRFDGHQGGDVVLDARWRILARDGAELAFRRSTLTEAVAGPGYEPMVAAMTRALLSLGREVAAQIRAMPL